MDDEEKTAVVVIGLAIAGAIGAALFFMRKPASAMVGGALSAVSPGGGWKNDERVDIVRNDDGLIDHITVHRDVQNQ